MTNLDKSIDEFISSLEKDRLVLKEWITDQSFRAISKKETLVFIGIQLYEHTKRRKEKIDWEAIHMWLSELFTTLDIYNMTESEKQGVTDRHFADLFAQIEEENGQSKL